MGPGKSALEATLRYFAVQLATNGITVNAVSLGLIDDSVINSLPTEAYSAIVDWNKGGWIPVKRMGTPAGIGNWVVLFASQEAGLITGQTLYVDGGASIILETAVGRGVACVIFGVWQGTTTSNSRLLGG